MDQVKFFKGCLPQILLGPFLNTLSHIRVVFIILWHQTLMFLTDTKRKWTIKFLLLQISSWLPLKVDQEIANVFSKNDKYFTQWLSAADIKFPYTVEVCQTSGNCSLRRQLSSQLHLMQTECNHNPCTRLSEICKCVFNSDTSKQNQNFPALHICDLFQWALSNANLFNSVTYEKGSSRKLWTS